MKGGVMGYVSHGGKAAAIAGWICLVWAFVTCVGVMVPFAPVMPSLELDGAWPYAINMAVARHLVFGRDIVFTAGPLSSVYTRQYSPATDTLMMVGAMLLAVTVIAAVLRATPTARRPLLLALPVLLSMYGMTDVIFLIIPWLLVAFSVHRPAGTRIDAILVYSLVGVCALLPLIKGSSSLSAVLCSGLAAVICARTHRLHFLTLPLVFVLTMAAAWCLSGQQLPYLPGYFLSQSSIIAGYGDAMSAVGETSQVWWFVGGATGVVACLVWLPRRSYLAMVPATALVLFISFKAGMIRHDGHADFAAGALLIVGLYAFLAISSPVRYLALIFGLIPSFVIMSAYSSVGPSALVRRTATLLDEQAQGGWSRLTAGDALHRRYDGLLAQIRASLPMPADGVTADLYTIGISAVLASGQTWSPRPVFQSYSAYTPELIQRNVDHLRFDAPGRIYLRMDSIDHRYVAMEDGASWPWLFGLYRPQKMLGDYLVLERTTASSPARIGKPVVSRVARLGEKVALPTGEPLWATIKMRRTVGGKALAALFKMPIVTLHLRFANGAEDKYRIVPGMMETGFLLSPTIRSSDDFLALWTGAASARVDGSVPVTMTIEVPLGGDRWWDEAYEVTLSPLSIPVAPPMEKPLDPTEDFQGSTIAGGDCNIEQLDGRDIKGSGVAPTGRHMTMTGWAVIDAHAGVPNDSVSMLLTEADGTRHLIHARRTPRGDVGMYFKQPQLVDIGFEATFDAAALKLPARVSVLQSTRSSAMECAQRTVELRADP